MDDSGTSALEGALDAVKRMFASKVDSSEAGDPKADPVVKGESKAKPKPEKRRRPAGYVTDSELAVISRASQPSASTWENRALGLQEVRVWR